MENLLVLQKTEFHTVGNCRRIKAGTSTTTCAFFIKLHSSHGDFRVGRKSKEKGCMISTPDLK